MSDTEKRITAKMVLDDTGYSSTLKGINAELKNTQSQFKVASSGLEAFGRNTKTLKSVQESLSKQLELQSKKVDIYKESISKTNDVMSKNIARREELKKSLSEATKKHEEAIKKYGEESKEVKETGEALDSLQKEYDNTSRAIETNAKKIQSQESNLNKAQTQVNKTTGELNKLNKELEKSNDKWFLASEKLNTTGESFNNIGKKVSDVGGKLTTHVTLPLAGVGIAAAKVGMDFEAQMDKVAAISGATGEDFSKLEAKAEEMGAKTKFSATDAGEGLEYMAMAGWKTGDMLDGIKPVLDLAIASGEELGTTSDIVTDALTAFGLKAKDAGEFSDVLAAASSNANTNVGMMGETFKYAAPVAGSLGYNVQDTALAIGLMANSGVKASQAGTALRAGLTNLVKPTDDMAAAMEKYHISVTDSNGTMKTFREVLGDLRTNLGSVDEATQANVASTIFGKEAMSGWLSIINASPDDFNKLASAIDNSEGATAQMAKTMSENAKGSIDEMKSALEEAGIKTFKALAPAITSVANTVSDLANKFSQLSPKTQENIVKMAAITMAAGPVISVLGGITKGIGGVTKGIASIAKAKGTINLAKTAVDTTKVASSIAEVGTAGLGASSGLASAGSAAVGIGTKLLAVAPQIAIGVGAVAAVGYAGYKTYQYLNDSATPAVDLFADKVTTTTTRIAGETGSMAVDVQSSTVKISESTKNAVGAYIDLDKKASDSLLNLRINSDTFTQEAKDNVLRNFEDMSNNADDISDEMKNNMVTDFKKLISDTGSLTEKNKQVILEKYTQMVNGCTKLTAKQKEEVIKNFTDQLNKSTAITKNQSEQLQKLYTDMTNKIKTGLDKRRDEELKSQKDFFSKSNVLTTKEEADILQRTTTSWDNKKKSIDNMQKQITDIISKAAGEHRQINEDEAKTIDDIQKKMKESAVKTLSDNEVEAKVILERMKDHDANITAEQVSQHIKQLNKSRDEAVKAANDECDNRIAEIIRMRDETGVISKDQAKKLIEDAKNQRDQTVQAAEDTRSQAVEKITSMNSDISGSVNTTTGEVKSNWDKLKDWWENWHPVKKIFEIATRNTGGEAPKGIMKSNWTGNSHFEGGFTTLHERGYELYDLPSGTRIYNHDASEELVKETARTLANQLTQNSKQGNIEIVQNVYAPVPTPSELARQTTNNFKELALSMN